MKPTFVKCDFCKVNICEKAEACVFAIHKRVMDSKEYLFCCEPHAEEFENKKKKKGK